MKINEITVAIEAVIGCGTWNEEVSYRTTEAEIDNMHRPEALGTRSKPQGTYPAS